VHGYDGAKKVNGRKRHLLVDTLGIVLKVHVTAASAGDRDGAAVLLDGIRAKFPRLSYGWADQGYRGVFLDWARQVAGITLQVAVRRDGGMRRSWAPAARRRGRCRALRSCPAAGSSSAPSPGWAGSGGWPGITSTCPPPPRTRSTWR
jgi:transposase